MRVRLPFPSSCLLFLFCIISTTADSSVFSLFGYLQQELAGSLPVNTLGSWVVDNNINNNNSNNDRIKQDPEGKRCHAGATSQSMLPDKHIERTAGFYDCLLETLTVEYVENNIRVRPLSFV